MRDPVSNCLNIIGSFTAEPLLRPLTDWLQRLEIEMPVRFAPSQQVFQQLLDCKAQTLNNQGINVVMVRLEDVVEASQSTDESADWAHNVVRELTSCLTQYKARTTSPLLCIVCPQSDMWIGSPQGSHFHAAESAIIEAFNLDDQVTVYSSVVSTQSGWNATFHDPIALREGHIPYKPKGYERLAKSIARYLHALLYADKYKAIVVDCDNTLWTGICGEGEFADVTIDQGRQLLQDRLIEQLRIGRMLCLCSKNNEADVWNIFDQHPDMHLKREHITAYRINWFSKQLNLRELAEDLNITLGSIIFLDDDAATCAEINSLLPDVMCFQVPPSGSMAEFLGDLWPFDKVVVTEDDRLRGVYYQQEKARKASCSATITHEQFLQSLKLEVCFEEVTESDVSRLWQLLQRTTQFNSAATQPTLKMLRDERHKGDLHCIAVRVKDRFGDYGLTGCMLYREFPSYVRVDSIALSCRVLGRGVEQHLWKFLRTKQQELGKAEVHFLFRQTERNYQVREFLSVLGAIAASSDGPIETYRYHDCTVGALTI